MQEHDNNSPPLLPEETLAALSPPLTDLEQEGQPRPSSRKRLIQIGIIVLAVGIVLGTFGNSLKRAVFPSPRTQPPTMMVIASNVNYGTITMNGKPQLGTLPLLAPIPSGAFVLTVAAPPFQPQSCRITSQHMSLDRCQLLTIDSRTMTLHGVTARVSFGVDIAFTASDLSFAARTQAKALLTQQLAAQQTTNVPIGSYLATSYMHPGGITSEQTVAPTQATALLTTNAYLIESPTDQQGYSCDGFTCTRALTLTQISALESLGGQNWMILVPLALRWRFNTSAGTQISDVVFPAVIAAPVDLVYTQGSGWQFAQPNSLTGPRLDPADELPRVACLTGLLLLSDQVNSTKQVTAADHGVAGCLYQLQAQTQDLGQFLWRFGVLLAADAKAHTTLPDLPLAPLEEIAAVEG